MFFPLFVGISNIFGILLYINDVIMGGRVMSIDDIMTGVGVKWPKKDGIIYVQPLIENHILV